MIQNASIDAAQYEAIFSAKYSPAKVGVILTIECCIFAYLVGDFACSLISDICGSIVVGESPLHFVALGSILLVLLVPILQVAFTPLFFKEINFYPNRVEIVRRMFPPKIVYYSRATVEKGMLTAGYLIEEAREKGKSRRTRFFYDIEPFLFASEARERLEAIFDYLSGDSSEKNPRVFTRSVLSREVLLDRPVRA